MVTTEVGEYSGPVVEEEGELLRQIDAEMHVVSPGALMWLLSSAGVYAGCEEGATRLERSQGMWYGRFQEIFGKAI